MSFVNTKYLYHIIAGGFFFFAIIFYMNRKYFNWVKTYWFFERTLINKISSLVYGLSLFLMAIALLDLRGPEERIKTDIPDQRTIIILDSSSSMLSEDIRPSRFGKAIQLARHFVKNAAGHQISIVLFSDIQKRLIPFTDDIDLLDSRLAALEKTNSVSGGSNISQAIAEATGYFDSDDKKATSGNILVFTDAEESEGEFDIDIASNINLAVVGIGTAKGGNIPLRWEDGSFKGYKTSKGEPVVTRLDEDYIKKIGKNVKNYNYWIANSYSLPTEDILNFFRGIYSKSTNKGDMKTRPVFSHLILIPAILLYCFAIFLGRFKSFKAVLNILILLSLANGNLHAQDEEKPAKKLPASLVREMNKMKAGRADRKEILKIAEGLLKNNEAERAKDLYAEYAKEDDEAEVTFNRATALLKSNKVDEAIPLVQEILKNGKDEKVKDRIRHNLLLALNAEGKGKGESKDQDQKDGNDKQDKKGDGKEGDQKDKDKEEKKGEKEKDNKEGKPGKDSKEEKKDNKPGEGKSDKEPKDKDKDGEPKEPKEIEQPKPPEGLKEKEDRIEKQRKMTKTPAMIKQILNDDRELQKKMMDTSTNERGSSKPKRDW